MSTTTAEHREKTLLRRRLEVYRRYAELVVRQSRALDDEDFARFDELAAAREELQGALEGTEHGALDMSDHEMRVLVSRVREELQRAADADAAMSVRLGRMRRQTADDIHAAERLEPKLRRYLEDDEAGDVRPRRINIKL